MPFYNAGFSINAKATDLYYKDFFIQKLIWNWIKSGKTIYINN